MYQWRKSSYSADAGNCVDIAAIGDSGIKLRESDDPTVVLDTDAALFRALIRAAKAGRLPTQGAW